MRNLQDRIEMVPRKKGKSVLVGVGLDSKDGHVRFTEGDDFVLSGGSEETHDRMTETAMKFSEKLGVKGKEIHELSREEFIDLLSESSA